MRRWFPSLAGAVVLLQRMHATIFRQRDIVQCARREIATCMYVYDKLPADVPCVVRSAWRATLVAYQRVSHRIFLAHDDASLFDESPYRIFDMRVLGLLWRAGPVNRSWKPGLVV